MYMLTDSLLISQCRRCHSISVDVFGRSAIHRLAYIKPLRELTINYTDCMMRSMSNAIYPICIFHKLLFTYYTPMYLRVWACVLDLRATFDYANYTRDDTIERVRNAAKSDT